MSDQDKIDEMKDVYREKKKEDGAFDGRFVQRSVPDKRKEKERRACRGEQEREAIEKSMEQDVSVKDKSFETLAIKVSEKLKQEFSHDRAEKLYHRYFPDLKESYNDPDKIIDQIILKENENKLEDKEPSFNPFAEELDDAND